MKPNNPRQILQNCLPGVTIYGGSQRSFHPAEESNESPTSYQYYSYQNKDMDTSHFEWIHQEQQTVQRRQSLKPWYLGLILILMMAITLYRSDSVSDATVVQVLSEQSDDYRQEILHALERLDQELEGDIVLQSNKKKFMDASRVWRQGEVSPLAIIQVKTQQDVALAMPILAGLTRDYDLEFTVRSGGYSSFSSTTGVVLSLTHLQALQWTTNHSTVVVEPGVRVEDFQQQVLYQKGYVGVIADAAQVGFGGFVLGGGYGLLSRKHGLGIDNVVRLRVVSINGIVQDVHRGEDLFWAILGSGGMNFGIVTEMEYKVYPSNDMKLAATLRLPINDVVDFLQRLGDTEAILDRNVTVRVHAFERQPDDAVPSLTTIGRLRGNDTWLNETHAFNATTEITIYWMGDCHPDSPVGMKYMKEHLVPLLPSTATKDLWFYYFSWSAMSRAMEQPNSWTTIWAAQSWNGFLYSNKNTPEVWNEIQQSFLVLLQYSQHIQPTIELWGGAIADVPINGTAFPHRQGLYHLRVDLMVPKDDNTSSTQAQEIYEQEVALVSAVWPSISKHLKGVFVNYPMPSMSQEEYPLAYWGNNLKRLVELKQRFDPFHVLRHDQSIPTLSN